jgi:hypothetical protein
MNKKYLRDAVAMAIGMANHEDAKVDRVRGDLDYKITDRRMRAFLSYLAGGLVSECPEANDLIMNFLDQVNWDKNPLLDAADSNKDKPQ